MLIRSNILTSSDLHNAKKAVWQLRERVADRHVSDFHDRTHGAYQPYELEIAEVVA